MSALTGLAALTSAAHQSSEAYRGFIAAFVKLSAGLGEWKRATTPVSVRVSPVPGRPRRWAVATTYENGETSTDVVCRRGIRRAKRNAGWRQ